MSRDLLPLTHLRGSAARCGSAYGEAFAPLLVGFCRQEVTPNPRRLAYARRCWQHVERSAPTSAAFLRGAARACHLSVEQATLITLHEEIVHQEHCTAFAATAGATGDGRTIVAQNWDWAPSLYPWPGLLRLDVRGSPRAVTYHYPGLWACAGVNEAGLALVWTGGGYFPRVRPVVGLPTYVLIAEILRLRTVDEALAYLGRTRYAGSFIFFLGAAAGAAAVVEAVPGKFVADRSLAPLSRANHYTCEAILECGKQVAPGRNTTTVQRAGRMRQLLEKHEGRIGPEVTKAILLDRGTAWPWLHQYPGGRQAATLDGMTIDSLFAVCQERVLWTCRGGREPGPWQAVPV